jgi:hypothetical protein
MRSELRVALGLFLIGLSIGGTISYAYFNFTNTVGHKATGACPSGVAGLVPEATFPPELFQLIINGLNNRPLDLSQVEFYTEFTGLFSDANFQSNTTLQFSFEFPIHSEFNPEMYAGNYSSDIWTYPSQVSLGYQDGLLLAYVQIFNLYGSPYGNSSDRGSNTLTMFLHHGNWSYGLGQHNAMVSAPFASSLAILNGAPIQTPDGFFVYNGLNFLIGNQTYYDGPPEYDFPFGTGTYDASRTVNQTGFLWTAALLAGSYREPLMTRYLFVINASRVPNLGSGCVSLQAMFNLTSLSPFATATTANFQVTDNFPAHRIDGPLNYSNYLTLELLR